MTPQRLLVISYYYAPHLNARAFRWGALAEHWAQRGVHIDVVTSGAAGAPQRESLAGVNIYRAGIPWLDRLRRVNRQQRGPAATTAASPRNALHTVLALANDRIWSKVYWPDATCLWYPSGLRVARALARSYDYDALVSVTPTFTPVVVARQLKRDWPDLRWVIDVGDPFSFMEHAPPNNLRLYRHVNVQYERSAFAVADAISVTTPATAKRYADLFPESAAKITVIPPLLSTPHGRSRERRHRDAPVKLVYVGTFYRNVREPNFLLQLFEELKASTDISAELHIYGDISSCNEAFVAYQPLEGRQIYVHGIVDRARVTAAVHEADILINIGNATTYQLPSKVVEYAATGKPIVNIAKSPGDSSVAFFARYPRKLDLYETRSNRHERQVAALREFITQPGGEITNDTLQAFLRPHTLDAIAAAYEGLLSRSCAHAPRSA